MDFYVFWCGICSKGKDLPDEFMESIYKSISEHPIVTFDDSPEGDMTVDRWRDLIKQVRAMSFPREEPRCSDG